MRWYGQPFWKKWETLWSLPSDGMIGVCHHSRPILDTHNDHMQHWEFEIVHDLSCCFFFLPFPSSFFRSVFLPLFTESLVLFSPSIFFFPSCSIFPFPCPLPRYVVLLLVFFFNFIVFLKLHLLKLWRQMYLGLLAFFSWFALVIMPWLITAFPFKSLNIFLLGNKKNPIATTFTIEK